MPTPNSWSDSVPVSLTGTTTLDALLADARWASVNVSYSFPGASATWSNSLVTGYGPSTDDQEPWSPFYLPLSDSDRGFFTSAIERWADVSGLQFTLVSETASSVGDIRAAYTSLFDLDAQAWAYLPDDNAYAGDVWFEFFGTSATEDWVPGRYEYLTVLHEIGHALGLKHPFESPVVLPLALDSMSFTIMSYSGRNGDSSTGFNFYPTTPMILDVAAIQHLYGANGTHRSGSDTYAYSNATPYHETIWDTGGADAIEYSGSLGAIIDLRAGVAYGSRIGLPVYVTSRDDVNLGAVNNVWIADGVVIENASGGSGADTLIGNQVANVLQGGAGADVLNGGAGNDSLEGGAILDRINGNDGNTASYSGSTAAINVDLGAGVAQDGMGGTDALADINAVIGSAFHDTFLGTSAAGSDLVESFEGGGGNDTLEGGAITDLLGFLDSNRAVYRNAGAAVTVDLLAGTATGGAGSDTLLHVNQAVGSRFNDTLRGSNAADLIETFDGGGGDDLIDGRGGFDVVRYASASAAVNVNLATHVALDGLGRTDTLQNIEGLRGSSFNDVLTGGDPLNAVLETFQGEGGSDTLNGGAGYDRADYSSSSAAVHVALGGTGNGSAQDGLGGTDRLINIEGVGGSSFSDTLTGSNSGVFESFEGRKGNDTINGQGRTDRADYFHAPAGVTVDLAAGTASDGYGGSDTLLNIEDLRGSRDFNDSLTGNSANNVLEGEGGDDGLDGGAGADTLSGGAGNDTLTGGIGDDVFVVDGDDDLLLENADEGVDYIRSAVGYTLLANFENLILTGSADVDGTGNGVSNALFGNAGANSLDGGAGNDTLTGGAGNDTLAGGLGNDLYVVDGASDVLAENANEGTDAVQSSASYVLAANLENLILSGDANLSGTGNALDNVLTGNAGANTLDGAAGADTLIGGAGNDYYIVDAAGDEINDSAGVDRVDSSMSFVLGFQLENLTLTGAANLDGTGNGVANRLTGNTGNNVLDGGVGSDTLAGGAGNDTYVIDAAGDVVQEGALQGIDTLRTPFATLLAANLENVVLTGTASVNLTGNTLDNALTGNSGNNVLDGDAGNDTLAGGRGDDTYVRDVAGDVVIELSGQGTDTLVTPVTTLLAPGLENLVLGGTASVDGTGNAAGNVIRGNAGNNVLDGAGGLDTMDGGAGNDTYVVDRLLEQGLIGDSGGIDTVLSSAKFTSLSSSMENLTLGSGAWIGLGNSGANVITGNAAVNLLIGGAGNDTLIGGGGSDELEGGAGADRFVFDTAPGGNNRDFIIDFSVAQGDRVALDNDIFGAAGPLGQLLATAFRAAAGATSGADASDRIVLDTASGAFYYDADGVGGVASIQIGSFAHSAGIGVTGFVIVD